MKSIIIIQFCVLLLTTVSNGDRINPLVDTLESMANENKSIDGVFELSKDNGLIREYVSSVIYKGKMMRTRTDVAMIFRNATPEEHLHEYTMYTYLSAINNPNVEAYGIPSIYYWGMWRGHAIMAMTLVDREFYSFLRCDKFNKIDLLIAIREYVRISKYMHTSGVFCEYIKLDKIRFRKHQGSIHVFRLAKSLPGKTPLQRLRAAREDWKEFLNSLYYFIIKPRWSWLGFSKKNPDDIKRMEDKTIFISSLINETDESHNLSGLRKVFVEFAKYAYCNDSITTTPFYDQLYQVIIEELERYAQQQKKPAIPSWLTNAEDKRNAILAINTIPSISIIRHPFESGSIEYNKVKHRYFRNLYHGQPSSSGASGEPDSGEEASKLFD